MNLETTFPTPGFEERDLRPMVALQRSGISGAAIAIVAIVGAILLFLILDGRRQRIATDQQQRQNGPATAFASPPPLTVPRELPTPMPREFVYPAGPQSQPGVTYAPRQQSQIIAPQPYPAPAMQAYPAPTESQPFTESAVPPLPLQQAPPTNDGPAVIIGSGVAHGSVARTAPGGTGSGPITQQAGEQGAAAQPVTMTQIADTASMMPAGTLIPAVLETPIDTARPGLVRAIVSKDARGFGGRQVLVPKGSRLIGEYQSEIGAGQNRVLVSWTRVIRPDGMTIRLAAPATDSTGGAGIPGRVNGFLLTRVVGAVFQTALAVGENLATRQTNTVIVGLPNGTMTNVAGQSLAGGAGPRRKITVRQGTLVNVFVAQDIDFAGATTGN